MGFAIQLLNHRNKYFLFFVFTLLQAQESIDSIVFKMNQHAQPVDIEMEIKVTLNSKNKKITKDSHYRLMNHLEKRYEDGKFKSKLLLRFIEPKEVRGLALLNWNWIDELKNDQWLYVPRLRKVKRIKPSESSRKFQGTEFTYGDIIEGDMEYENYKFFKKDYCFGNECYLLKRDSKNSRIILNVNVQDEELKVPSICEIYPSANFYEREVFDMFGIEFENHPELTRILMPDDWEGNPLRKDYGTGRIPVQFKNAPKVD